MKIKDKVLHDYPKLSKTSSQIADYLLENPAGFLTNNAQELGKITKTSAASVVRFCQQLEFKGLKDFQLQLAQDAPQKENDDFDTIVANGDTSTTVLLKLEKSLQQNLTEFVKLNNTKEIGIAASLLRQADSIYLEGVAASGLPAKDLYYKLIRIGRKAFYDDDVHIALEQSYFTTPKDVMIIFSYSGQTEEILLAARQAHHNQTPIIAITRDSNSALSQLASIILPLPSNEQLLRVGAINSLFSEMTMSCLLYLCLIAKDVPKLENRMKATSRITNHLKEKN